MGVVSIEEAFKIEFPFAIIKLLKKKLDSEIHKY